MPSSVRSRRRISSSLTGDDAQLSLFPALDLTNIVFALPTDADLRHTTTDVTFAADGAVVVSRCTCGGRGEALLDPGLFASVRSGGRDNIEDVLSRALGSTPRQVMDEWLTHHRGCAKIPLRFTFGEPLAHLIEAAWETAVDALANGDSAAPALFILCSPTDVRPIPLDGYSELVANHPCVPTGFAAHRRVASASRRAIREVGGRPLGVVLVAEAWVAPDDSRAVRPSQHPDRQSALTLFAASPEYGIERVGHINQTTPGGEYLIQEVVEAPITSICPVIDGMLASLITADLM